MIFIGPKIGAERAAVAASEMHASIFFWTSDDRLTKSARRLLFALAENVLIAAAHLVRELSIRHRVI
jgi:hypothetical protein